MNTNLAEKQAESIEQTMETAGNTLVDEVSALRVVDNASYERAVSITRSIKNGIARVKDYWKDPKCKAAAAHREICARENAMLSIYQQAETILRNAMNAYQRQLEQERMRAEADARRKAQEERDRLLAEAVAAEAAGDVIGAEEGVAMASMVEDMPVTSTAYQTPKAEGASVRKTWKARVINDALVPVTSNGAMLRPVDMSVLNKLAVATAGSMSIPGVEFYQESNVIVRR